MWIRTLETGKVEPHRRRIKDGQMQGTFQYPTVQTGADTRLRFRSSLTQTLKAPTIRATIRAPIQVLLTQSPNLIQTMMEPGLLYSPNSLGCRRVSIQETSFAQGGDRHRPDADQRVGKNDKSKKPFIFTYIVKTIPYCTQNRLGWRGALARGGATIFRMRST